MAAAPDDAPQAQAGAAASLISSAFPAAAGLVGVGAAAPGPSNGIVWKWVRQWLEPAAIAAPTRTEALLHQFLGQVGVGPGGGGVKQGMCTVCVQVHVFLCPARMYGGGPEQEQGAYGSEEGIGKIRAALRLRHEDRRLAGAPAIHAAEC